MAHADPLRELLAASGQGRLGDIIDLIQSGLSVNASNDCGYTPLMSAARSYRIEVVSYLLSVGADVHVQTTESMTVLHIAVGATPTQPERQASCVRALLTAGADPNAQSDTGSTPLMKACWFGCSKAIEVLLEFGADSTLEMKDGRTALALAEAKNQTEIIQRLRSQ